MTIYQYINNILKEKNERRLTTLKALAFPGVMCSGDTPFGYFGFGVRFPSVIILELSSDFSCPG